MAHVTSRPRKTVEDLLALPDDVRAELIAGDIYVNPPPTLGHQRAAFLIAWHLEAWASPRAAGRVFTAPVGVLFPTGDFVEPDVVFVSQARSAILRPKWIEGVPDLLVEAVSPSRPDRDRIVKRDLYAKNGVPEYWIADPEDRAIEVLRLEATAYQPAGYFQAGSVLRSPSLPGFSVPVDDVFRP